MSYEMRKKQREKKKKIRRLMVLTIFLYFVIRSLPAILGTKAKTVLPEEKTIIDSLAFQGTVIKDEVVYKTEVPISDDDKINEGEKVPVGYRVGNVNLLEDFAGIKKELEEVEEAINLLSKSEEEIASLRENNKLVRAELDGLADSIQENLSEYGKVKELKNIALENNSKLVNLSPDNRFLDQDLEVLKTRYEVLQNEINNNDLMFTTENSGLISYDIDGYEDMLVSREWEIYTLDKLREIRKKDIKDKTKGFKIVDNFIWYLGIEIDDFKDIGEYEVGDLIRVQVGENDRELIGKIMGINRSKDEGVIIARFNSYFEDYYNLRFPTVSIINSKNEGFRIPIKCIVEQDGVKGVFIRQFNGIVRFRPVKIIKEDKSFAYVIKGDSGNIILKEGEDPVKTITLYDEILLNPSGIKEGEILD